jgi:hypothetical protein
MTYDGSISGEKGVWSEVSHRGRPKKEVLLSVRYTLYGTVRVKAKRGMEAHRVQGSASLTSLDP